MFLISQVVMGVAFSRRLKRSREFIKYQIIFGVIFLFGIIFLEISDRLNGETIRYNSTIIGEIISTVLFCITLLLLIAAWIYKSYQVTFIEAMYASGMTYLAQHAYYCFDNLLAYRFAFVKDTPVPQIISVLGILIAAIVVDRFIARKMIHERHYIANVSDTIPLLTVIILIVMLASAIATTHGFVIYHSIYSLVFCIYILFAQLERQQSLYTEGESKVREQLLVTQQAQYKIYKENVDLLNRKSHDLKHQIAALRMLHDNKSGEAVINSIADTVRIYDSFVRTGNEGLDTILTSKNQACMEKDILFTCIADGKALNHMDPVDLFTLFGNLMDNAIEAVEHLPKEKRSISLSIKEQLGMVMVNEENPYASVNKSGSRLLTTKEDKDNHGYGIRSMEMVAQKYDGTLSIDIKDGIFSLSAIFYN